MHVVFKIEHVVLFSDCIKHCVCHIRQSRAQKRAANEGVIERRAGDVLRNQATRELHVKTTILLQVLSE